MKPKFLFITCIFFLASSAGHDLHADQVPGWKSIKLSQQSSDGKQARGFMLYTTDKTNKGAAFRCEWGRMYTFLGVKPVDFRKILQQRSSKLRDREITFSINDSAEVVEDWVQMFSGKIYMAREISTNLAIFRAAAKGANISFTRKYGETVTISLPILDQSVSGAFLDGCDLKANHDPEAVKNQ